MEVTSKKNKQGAIIELHNKFNNKKLFIICQGVKEIKHHNRILKVKPEWRGKIFNSMPIHNTCEPAPNQVMAVEELKMWFKRCPVPINHYTEITEVVGKHKLTETRHNF